MICFESDEPFATLFQRQLLNFRLVTLPNKSSQVRIEALQPFLSIYILIGLLMLLKELSLDRQDLLFGLDDIRIGVLVGGLQRCQRALQLPEARHKGIP